MTLPRDRPGRSPRYGRRLAALLLCSITALAQAGPVRLVLDSGWVLPLNADGSDFAGEFQQIALPYQQYIYAVATDYVTGRLYVTLAGPQPPDQHYVTQVHDLATLQPLGTLDDVAEVLVPDDDGDKTLLTRRYQTDDGDRYGGSTLVLLEELDSRVRLQLRDRRRVDRVLAQSGSEARQYQLLPRCHLGGRRPFLMVTPPWRGDRQFKETFQRGALNAESERARTSGMQRDVQACLPGGDTLELEYAQPQWTPGIEGSGLRAIVQRHGAREVRRYSVPQQSLEMPGTPQYTRLLGKDSRFVVFAAQGLVLDRQTGAVTSAAVSPVTARWTQRSADANTLYSFPHIYSYRSILSDTYTEGGSRWFTGGVERLSLVDGAAHSDSLPLPETIRETLEREDQRLAAFRARLERPLAADADSLDNEENRAADAEQQRLEEPTPLEQRLGRFSIIAVLDP